MLPAGENIKVFMTVPRDGDIFSNPLFVELEELADGDDVISENNRIRVNVPAVKKVFVEEYTTERCSNCPRVARYLHEVGEEDTYRDRIVVVCHHAGFYTDWLTLPIDEELVKFFNIGFAPAVSYDRYPYFSGDIVNCPDKAELRKTFDTALSKSPGVKIAITPTYDLEARKANVVINLERTTLNIDNPHLTVFLTEDCIPPFRQSGNSDGTHIHNHVIRQYNSTWGDPITWIGSNCTMTYEFEIEDDWNTENLNIVAVVGNVNSDDRMDNVIDNAEEISLISSSASVAEINADTTILRTDYFDLSGYRVAASTPGFKIAVKTLSDGTLITEKLFCK